MAVPFDFGPLLSIGLPVPVAKWTGFRKYNFIGGHNDAEQVPVDGLIAATTAVLRREGARLATYNDSGPLGHYRLREFLTTKLRHDAGICCTTDEILITSGSLQAIDLINGLLLSPGDTVLTEQVTYPGSLNRLARLGVDVVGIPLDHEGLRIDALSAALDSSNGAASALNTSTPFRQCRTRPAPSWGRRVVANFWQSPRPPACRSSRTTAMPT